MPSIPKHINHNDGTTTMAEHLEFDPGLLCVTDTASRKSSDPSSSTHSSVQALLAHLVSTLPLTVNPDHGPIITLPLPTIQLPRAKPLPKPKPLTKWQQFAKAKGIPQNKQRETKLVYDEATHEWVPRWGFKGANKNEEEAWIHEVPANADDNYDPSKAMKAERKKRRLHNEGQRLRNEQRAAAAEASKKTSSSGGGLLDASTSGLAAKEAKARERLQRKAELDAGVLRGRHSTASMGKFDAYLKGESARTKGARRSFAANEQDDGSERKRQLDILGKIGRDGEKGRDVVNSRKAVRFHSGGEGALSMAGKEGGKRKR